MAQKTDVTTIGHIFLTLGIFGYYLNFSPLGVIGLSISFLCHAQTLIRNYLAKPTPTTQSTQTENKVYSGIQTVSPQPTTDITIRPEGGSL